MSEPLHAIAKLFERIENLSYDRESIPQDKLNIVQKSRSSLFPWRGQFSPELIELLLDHYSKNSSVILDPFVGSGTTLFESARKGLTCYGTEINPSAVEMARTSHFVNLDLKAREKLINTAEAIAQECLLPYQWDLFSYQLAENHKQQTGESFSQILAKIWQKNANNSWLCNLIINAVIRYHNYRSPKEVTEFLRALREHDILVNALPYSPNKCRVKHADARAIPLPDSSVDLIITSPPYINVFNYHQNNRKAMELMGWNLLDVAKSEIGSNRKNRQNRFLTVVQYAIDMLDAAKEMRRLLRPNGRAIVVIGRTSKIRGIDIENGRLMAAIAIGGAGFSLERLQERKFKNKFGEIIYEDILHLVPASVKIIAGDEFARLAGKLILLKASHNAEGDVLKDILDAKLRASGVKRSPFLKTNIGTRAVSNC